MRIRLVVEKYLTACIARTFQSGLDQVRKSMCITGIRELCGRSDSGTHHACYHMSRTLLLDL